MNFNLPRSIRLKACAALLLAVFLAGSCASAEDALKPVVINELMASNHHTIEDALGKYSDWIELYNPNSEAVSLAGYCLSDKLDEPERFVFPEGAVIPANGYLLVFASGITKPMIDDQYHAPFKLSAAGESLFLSLDGNLIDSVRFVDQQSDISYARTPEGTFAVTECATPGMENIFLSPKTDGE